MASGFSFLRTQFPGLEKTGEFAERYLYSDSNSCLFKLGLLCEDIVNKMFDFDNIAMPYQMKDTLVNKIRLLENEEYITEDLARIMHRLRLGGNEARHEGTDSLQKAKLLLPQAYSLCVVHAGVWRLQLSASGISFADGAGRGSLCRNCQGQGRGGAPA